MIQMIHKLWNEGKLGRLLKETLERGTTSKTSISKATKICTRPKSKLRKNCPQVEATTPKKERKKLPQKVMS